MMPDHPERVAVVGDWHANHDFAETVINAVADAGAEVIVHVGDFGFHIFGKDSERHLRAVENACGSRNLPLFWVDGNRDNHYRLHRSMVDPYSGLRAISPHVFHLPRGYRWTWHEKDWLALGGAYSVGRRADTEGQRWWRGEVLSGGDIDRAVRGGRADVMITHDAPNGTDILGGMDLSRYSDAHLAAAGEHRAVLGSVVDAVRPSRLFHGHYHVRRDFVRPMPEGVTRVSCLSGDREGMAGNWVLLDAETNETVLDSGLVPAAA